MSACLASSREARRKRGPLKSEPPQQEPVTAGLYIHVPFCTSVCPYCDFAVTIAGEERRAAWTEGVVCEAAMYDDRGLAFDTVYLGGGTPSSVAVTRLESVLGGLREKLRIAEDALCYLEVNPEDVTPESTTAWRRLGIDVISLGVQSFADRELQFLGRAHSVTEARAAVETLLAAGFDTVSVDLIYGLAGQSAEQWRLQLEHAVALGIDHLSCYQLTYHRGTIFGRRLERGVATELGEPVQAELFFLTHQFLTDNGYEGYEVSSFATAPEHRSRHNQKYWDHTPYLGLGPSAHSFANGRRWWNRRKLRLWQSAVDSGRPPIEGEEELSPEQLGLEALLLGLRTTDGVELTKIRERYGIDLQADNAATIDRLCASDHLRRDGDHLRPTLAGLAIADVLAASFDL
jgi:putative oxygen-independent coproporphyrinogen III oxidase